MRCGGLTDESELQPNKNQRWRVYALFSRRTRQSGNRFQIGGVQSGLARVAGVDDGVQSIGDDCVGNQRIAIPIDGYGYARRKRPLRMLGAYNAN